MKNSITVGGVTHEFYKVEKEMKVSDICKQCSLATECDYIKQESDIVMCHIFKSWDLFDEGTDNYAFRKVKLYGERLLLKKKEDD